MERPYKYRKLSGLGITFLLLISLSVPVKSQIENNLNVYVWDFVTRNEQKNDLTRNLTTEFEEALVQRGCFTVLVRRQYDKLIAHKDNERSIMAVNDISSESTDELKAIRADAVVFGEVYHDVKSGDIKIAVFVQKFDGTTEQYKSIRLDRGLQDDGPSREQAMRDLAEQTCLPPSTPTPEPPFLPDETPISHPEKGKSFTPNKFILIGGVGAVAAVAGLLALSTGDEKEANEPKLLYDSPNMAVSKVGKEIVVTNKYHEIVAIRVSWDGVDPWGTGAGDSYLNNSVSPGSQIHVQFKEENNYSSSMDVGSW